MTLRRNMATSNVTYTADWLTLQLS